MTYSVKDGTHGQHLKVMKNIQRIRSQLSRLKECHRICSKCFAVGTPLDIATGMCYKDFCVICEKSETHLTGDGVKLCELIRSNLHSELQKLLVAYKLIGREMVYRIENHGAP